MKRDMRAKIYFRLMDICLGFAGIGLLDEMLDILFDRSILPVDSTAYAIVQVFTLFFNFVVPPFLIIAGSMRDEYAEQLWQRSIKVLIYIFAIVPLAINLPAVIYYQVDPIGIQNSVFALLWTNVNGWGLIIQVHMAFLLLWVGIFQFLRWRDAR